MTADKEKIIDNYGRVHDYLRISLTERCNLRCFYCMPEEGVPLRDKSNFMTSEEVVAIATTFVEMGVKKIRLTGGEPLIKKDAKNLILALGKLPVELCITTNAVLVDQFIDVFKEAEIKSVNVSLDSLEANRFNAISKRSFFDRIKSNIDLLIEEGFKVKVNVVVIKGVNEDEIASFIDWSTTHPVHIRFIEFMPFDGNNWQWDKKVSHQEMMTIATNHFGTDQIEQIANKPNDTARIYRLLKSKGTFGVISTVTNPFCDTCNRIRLTADGKIKNCLFSQSEIDLLTNYRKKRDLKPLILESILSKEKSRGGFDNFNDETVQKMENRSMITIGG